MPQEIRIIDLYTALSDIEGWIHGVRIALGSLDPKEPVPADGDRIAPLDGPVPIPLPLPAKPGVCHPLLRIPGPPENR